MAAGKGRSIAVPPPARPVFPDSVLTAQEAQRIQALRSRASQRVTALRDDLDELAAALKGAVPSVQKAVVPLQSRISVYRSLLSETQAAPPTVSADQGSADILAAFAKYGLRDRSFDQVVPVTAPKPIDNVGESYDAGAVYDAWILNPSIDCKFDWDKVPSQNTPFISANSRMQFQVRKQKVYYLAQNPNSSGVLQIWLLKFAGT